MLSLSLRWNFDCVRELASKHLHPLATPIDKIVYGRQHADLWWWLRDAYVEICKRDAPLTLEEGRRLGIEDVISIDRIRHEIRSRTVVRQDYTIVSMVLEALGRRVALASIEHSTVRLCQEFAICELTTNFVPAVSNIRRLVSISLSHNTVVLYM